MKFAHMLRLVFVCGVLPLQSLAGQTASLRAARHTPEANISLDTEMLKEEFLITSTTVMKNNDASFLEEQYEKGKSDGKDLRRPNDGVSPTVIKFRMLLREFFGVDEMKGTIMYDLVLSYAWKDPRIVSLIPDGKETANVPATLPASVMWNPKIVVTSRDFNGLDYIASTVEIDRTGKALCVQRFLYAGKNKLNVELYPFDKQTLTVLIVSAPYMMEDVELAVIPGMAKAGVGPIAFKGRPFTVTNTSTWEFKEISGPLRKSRGRFDIVVQRKWVGPLRKLGTSQLLLLFQAYSVFFIPVEGFAMMPRVATCLITFLALMSVQTSQNLPPASGPTWVELANRTMMMLILASLVLNGLIHLIAFSWKDGPLAIKSNHECRIIFGALAALMLFVVGVGTQGMFIAELGIFNMAAVLVVVIGYIVHCNINFAVDQKEAHKAAAGAAPAK